MLSPPHAALRVGWTTDLRLRIVLSAFKSTPNISECKVVPLIIGAWNARKSGQGGRTVAQAPSTLKLSAHASCYDYDNSASTGSFLLVLTLNMISSLQRRPFIRNFVLALPQIPAQRARSFGTSSCLLGNVRWKAGKQRKIVKIMNPRPAPICRKSDAKSVELGMGAKL